MTRRDFTFEYAGIVHLLKDHAWLQYSPAGYSEFREKEIHASLSFTALVEQASGLSLKLPSESLVRLDGAWNTSLEGARVLCRRASALCRRRYRDSGGEGEWREAAEAWDQADASLGRLPVS